MKHIIATLALLAATNAVAIPITEAPPGLLAVGTVIAPGIEIKGYERVTKRYWQIHGRDRKFVWEPVLGAVSAVPEADSYAMLLAGMGLVAWRVHRVRK